MNLFTSTTLNYDRVQERRGTFERAAARRRLTRAARRDEPRDAALPLRRPPDAVSPPTALDTRAA